MYEIFVNTIKSDNGTFFIPIDIEQLNKFDINTEEIVKKSAVVSKSLLLEILHDLPINKPKKIYDILSTDLSINDFNEIEKTIDKCKYLDSLSFYTEIINKYLSLSTLGISGLLYQLLLAYNKNDRLQKRIIYYIRNYSFLINTIIKNKLHELTKIDDNDLILKKDKIIYRATNHKEVDNRESWYSYDIYTAMLYVFNPIKLNDPHNVRLSELKSKYRNIHLYKIINTDNKIINLSNCSEIDKLSDQFIEKFPYITELYNSYKCIRGNVSRSPIFEEDRKFVNFLCSSGYDGYISNKINNLHPELMFCNPINNITYQSTYTEYPYYFTEPYSKHDLLIIPDLYYEYNVFNYIPTDFDFKTNDNNLEIQLQLYEHPSKLFDRHYRTDMDYDNENLEENRICIYSLKQLKTIEEQIYDQEYYIKNRKHYEDEDEDENEDEDEDYYINIDKDEDYYRNIDNYEYYGYFNLKHPRIITIHHEYDELKNIDINMFNTFKIPIILNYLNLKYCSEHRYSPIPYQLYRTQYKYGYYSECITIENIINNINLDEYYSDFFHLKNYRHINQLYEFITDKHTYSDRNLSLCKFLENNFRSYDDLNENKTIDLLINSDSGNLYVYKSNNIILYDEKYHYKIDSMINSIIHIYFTNIINNMIIAFESLNNIKIDKSVNNLLIDFVVNNIYKHKTETIDKTMNSLKKLKISFNI